MAEDKKIIDRFKDKKVAIIGMGTEGLSSALFLIERGAQVTILDEKEEGKISWERKKLLLDKGIKTVSGRGYLKNLTEYDLILRSPGIKLNIPELEAAAKKGIEITSQTKLFFGLCPCKIIGVTGTKGKGTTSSLIYEMLKKEGFDAYLGGNIGRPPFEFLDKLNEHSVVVLELSSFQLEDLDKSPHVAVALMITQEHLAPDKKEGAHQNYHKDAFEYVEAKRNIFKFQTHADFAIINKDHPASDESDVNTEAHVFKISRLGEVGEGCYVENDKIFIKKTNISLPEEIIETKDILLPGAHNLENVCAATMAADLMGVSKKNIAKVLKTFKGLEHRLELITEIKGARYYDDSFSTTPETAIAAVLAFKDPEILILGGASKGSDFKELGRVIRDCKNIKAIIGIGVEWPKIKLNIRNKKLKIKIIEGLKDMKEIVRAAAKIAEEGDVVLLSPACSSFDMFKNYKERGDLFKEEVKKLAK